MVSIVFYIECVQNWVNEKNKLLSIYFSIKVGIGRRKFLEQTLPLGMCLDRM